MTSKVLYLMLTHGNEEELVIVLSETRYPNELGAIIPPITVEHQGVEYILKRQWNMMQDTYIYRPSKKKQLDDILDL